MRTCRRLSGGWVFGGRRCAEWKTSPRPMFEAGVQTSVCGAAAHSVMQISSASRRSCTRRLMKPAPGFDEAISAGTKSAPPRQTEVCTPTAPMERWIGKGVGRSALFPGQLHQGTRTTVNRVTAKMARRLAEDKSLARRHHLVVQGACWITETRKKSTCHPLMHHEMGDL